MYYLYKKDESIIWPSPNNRLSLKLEQINLINNLYEGMSHDAEVDVYVTIELAKRLRNVDHKMWDYLISSFLFENELNHFNNLPSITCIDDSSYKIGVLISSKNGLKSNYCAPIIYLSEPSKDKIMALRLDNYNFSELSTLNYKFSVDHNFNDLNFLISLGESKTAIFSLSIACPLS